MDPAQITEANVKQALDALRRANSLAANPLLALEVLRARLRAEGISVNANTLEWGLGGLLHECVSAQLHWLRADGTGQADPNAGTGPGAARVAAPPTPAQEKVLLARDFEAGNIEREAWSSLYYRFVAGLGLSEKAIGAIAKPGYAHADRHIRRRLSRGYRLLADTLREAERDAHRAAGLLPGASAADRVLVEAGGGAAGELSCRSPGGESAGDAVNDPDLVSAGVGPAGDAAEALLAALREEDRLVVLEPAEAEALAGVSPGDWTTYRLGRVAAWSRPRYRLDTRFVDLTLLVDQGPTAEGESWATEPRRFDGLGAVLAALPDPVLVLLGPPGGGKSALLRRLELDLAIAGLRAGIGAPSPSTRTVGGGGREVGGDTALTFYLSLAAFPESSDAGEAGPDPAAWMAEQWRRRFPRLPALGELLDAGRLVLLLDGLNEMPHAGPADYRAKVGLWKRFVRDRVAARPGNRAVFACRSLDYSAPLSAPALPVPHLRLEPLSDAQIQRFLALYHPVGAESLWRALADTGRVALARRPYFLRLTLDELAATGAPPEGRAALFTHVVRRALARELARDNPRLASERLLGERDRRRIVQDAWPGPQALPEQGCLISALAALAFGMQAGRRSTDAAQLRLPYEDALALVDDPEGEAILRAGLDLGILDEDTAQGTLQFFHQLLQEYFAARRLAAAPEPARLRVPWRVAEVDPPLPAALAALAPADPLPPLPATGWEETALLAAEMAQDAAGFLRGLMDANLPLAGRCAAGLAGAGEDSLPAPLLAELRSALVARSRDPEADLRARIAAGLALGPLGDPRFERREGPAGVILLPPLAEIAGGRYPIGGRGGGATEGARARSVALGPFALARFPVTNAEWACFMAAGGYEDGRWWDTPAAAAWREGESTALGARWNYRAWRARFRADSGLLDEMRAEGRMPRAVHEAWRERLALSDAAFEARLVAEWPAGPRRAPEHWDDARFGNPAQPVVGVCWFEARAYARWLAAQSGLPFRLPTEAEWEAAARGAAGRRYAYGDAFDVAACNGVGTHLRRTASVGIFPAGDTPEGLADMSGNIWEWTSSLWGPDAAAPAFNFPYRAEDGREDGAAPADILRVARGGSWLNGPDLLLASHRYPFHPGHRNELYGFRLACERG